MNLEFYAIFPQRPAIVLWLSQNFPFHLFFLTFSSFFCAPGNFSHHKTTISCCKLLRLKAISPTTWFYTKEFSIALCSSFNPFLFSLRDLNPHKYLILCNQRREGSPFESIFEELTLNEKVKRFHLENQVDSWLLFFMFSQQFHSHRNSI